MPNAVEKFRIMQNCNTLNEVAKRHFKIKLKL